MSGLWVTGTANVSVTNGSPNVVGTGTTWLSSLIAGDWFSTDATIWYEILTVTDNTSLVLSRNYAGSTSGASNYFAPRASFARDSISQFSRQFSSFVTALGGLIDVSGASRIITLDKTAGTDNAGNVLKQGGTSLFQVGCFGNGVSNNDWKVQYLVGATWTNAISVNVTSGAITLSGGIAGNLALSGDFAIATTKFTVASATGNTVIQGILTAAVALIGGTTKVATGYNSVHQFQVNLSSGGGVEFVSINTGTAGIMLGFFYNNTTNVGTVTISATTTSYNTSSDRNRKFDERPYLGAGNVIDALKIWDFAWRSAPDTRGVGVFAQDAYAVFPAAITPSDMVGGWQADYSKLVPVLVADAQDTHKRLDELMAECAALRSELASISVDNQP